MTDYEAKVLHYLIWQERVDNNGLEIKGKSGDIHPLTGLKFLWNGNLPCSLCLHAKKGIRKKACNYCLSNDKCLDKPDSVWRYWSWNKTPKTAAAVRDMIDY